MDKVWGAPSVVPPDGAAPFFLVAERGIPGMVIVDGRGDRFVNEAAPYHEFVDAMYTHREKTCAETVPSRLILDARARRRHVFMGLLPGQPFPRHLLESGVVKKAATAPYYAVPVHPGGLGTKGGLLTDADARVLRADGSPIAGLYAAGNVAAAVMGETYPGPGATIGPAMAFGWIAVEHLAASGPTDWPPVTGAAPGISAAARAVPPCGRCPAAVSPG